MLKLFNNSASNTNYYIFFSLNVQAIIVIIKIIDSFRYIPIIHNLNFHLNLGLILEFIQQNFNACTI